METALVLEIPEAEPAVSRWRMEHDAAAMAGMPAHVTLIYPFAPSAHFDEEAVRKLRKVFKSASPFDLVFAGTNRFPDTLWLAPADPEPIVTLIRMLVEAFPDYPPYGGAFAEIVPHLTVAHAIGDDAFARLDAIEAAFRSDASAHLPIRSVVRRGSLFKKRAERWQRTASFPFAA